MNAPIVEGITISAILRRKFMLQKIKLFLAKYVSQFKEMKKVVDEKVKEFTTKHEEKLKTSGDFTITIAVFLFGLSIAILFAWRSTVQARKGRILEAMLCSIFIVIGFNLAMVGAAGTIELIRKI